MDCPCVTNSGVVGRPCSMSLPGFMPHIFGPRLLQTSLVSLMIVGLPLIHRLGIQTPLPRARPTGVHAEPASTLSHDSSGKPMGPTPLGHSSRPPWASSHALGAPMWCTIRRPEPSTCVAWPASPYREAINLVPRMRKPAPSLALFHARRVLHPDHAYSTLTDSLSSVHGWNKSTHPTTARASLSDKFSRIWLAVRTIVGRGDDMNHPSTTTVDWQCTDHGRLW